MSAFSVTSEFVTNDFGSATGTTVSIPLDAWTWADMTSRAASGGSAFIPLDSVIWSDKTFDVRPGRRISIPLDAITWDDKIPMKSSGKRIVAPVDAAILWDDMDAYTASGGSAIVPVDTISMSTIASMRSGGSVFAPVSNLTWTDKTPLKSSGKSVFIPEDVAIIMDEMDARISSGGSALIPSDNLTLTTVVRMWSGGSIFAPVSDMIWVDKTPMSSSGSNIWIPTDTVIVWSDEIPRVSAGSFVGIDTDVLMDSNMGVTTEDVTAGYMTLEGELSLFDYHRLPDRITLTSKPISMRSGGSARIPYDSLVITEQRAEIGARLRRLRTSAIAS